MIGQIYKAHRDNVIDLYEGYLRKRADFDSAMNSKEGDGIDLNFLELRMNSLKNGKFTLAIAGEVKSGKSTFINALLGTELLPSDVLQSTSAIVEIFKSEKSFFKVKYADGHEEVISDDMSTHDVNEAKEKLHAMCKISDQFRGIPITLIDKYISNSNFQIELTEAIIKEWQGEMDSDDDPISLLDNKALLIDYIKTRTKDKIPAEIQFGYPLKWEFDELRIVDSPGVNAVGGFQYVSFSYLESANAILFIHPIKPIESKSFRGFVNNIISNRKKETLFLVLTHSGLYPESDVERLRSEAIHKFRKWIPEERILVVDSLLQLIVHDLKNGKTLEEIEGDSNQKLDILPKFVNRAKKANMSLMELLEDSSGFRKMYEAIDQFSMQAPGLQLKEILEAIKIAYDHQDEMYSSKKELLESERHDPQEFARQIGRITKALDEYKKLMNETKEEFNSKYTGKNTDWQKRIDTLKNKYPKLINDSVNIETARKNVVDGLNEIADVMKWLSSQMRQDLEDRLKRIGEEFKQEHNITTPKIDLLSIEDETKRQSFRVEEIYEKRPVDLWDFVLFGIISLFRDNKVKVGEKEIYDKDKHLKLFKNACNEEFSKVINGLFKQAKGFIDAYLKHFKDSVNKVIDLRQEALRNKELESQSNEELVSQINMLGKKKEQLTDESRRIKEILGNLK